ncbi:transposase IS3/IS911 family protein [Amycolatopsis methanolica 239]|uniref:Transposase IS3/IS911 family protein n=1 Tax=Amycolatopsis methanolica 239 TaxID=1068978 RepID=A0A076N463_AMYME|nr:transposase IS3/IS911 family protein [Amycolatopsis methanolica 239]AIJ24757.1 transposase IS3/IS911 family protein [Amycolatopsis methanolica 239]
MWIVKALKQQPLRGGPGARAAGELAAAERAELDRLRRENRELKQSNEILKLASAFFAIQIAPRTYRKARRRSPSSRDIADARVENALRGVAGKPEAMYGGGR